MPLPTYLDILGPLRLEQIRPVQAISETMMMDSGRMNITRIIMKVLNLILAMSNMRITTVSSSRPSTDQDRVSTLKSTECPRFNMFSLDVTKTMFARDVGFRTSVLH